jgi:hypothetical protein
VDRPVGSQFGDADRGGGATNGTVKMRAPHSDANETAAFKLQCICLTALARSVTVPVRENLDIEVTASELAASRYVARIRVGDLIGEHCRICRGFKRMPTRDVAVDFPKSRGLSHIHASASSRGMNAAIPADAVSVKVASLGITSLADSLVDTVIHTLPRPGDQGTRERPLNESRESAVAVVVAVLERLGGTTRKKGLLPFHHAVSQQLLQMAGDLAERK